MKLKKKVFGCITINRIAFHRNGVSGIGFHVALFKKKGEDHGMMMGVVFPEQGACAVFNVDMLKDGNIDFAEGNSWRGDYYEPDLRKAIAQYEKESIEALRKKLVKQSKERIKEQMKNIQGGNNG